MKKRLRFPSGARAFCFFDSLAQLALRLRRVAQLKNSVQQLAAFL